MDVQIQFTLTAAGKEDFVQNIQVRVNYVNLEIAQIQFVAVPNFVLHMVGVNAVKKRIVRSQQLEAQSCANVMVVVNDANRKIAQNQHKVLRNFV
mmetsp:Transcript_14132/g.17522  ORF Transcript_14132/g.17522 Transcript_14132/m.17522 type:complete len:95 (+) Transcript_14132:106-390(+)